MNDFQTENGMNKSEIKDLTLMILEMSHSRKFKSKWFTGSGIGGLMGHGLGEIILQFRLMGPRQIYYIYEY